MNTKGTIEPQRTEEGDGFPNISSEQLEQHPKLDMVRVNIKNGPTLPLVNATGKELLPGDEVEIEITTGRKPGEGVNYRITKKLSTTATEAQPAN